MLAAGIACYRAWCRTGLTPAMVAGHSLGEYTALVAAGVLQLADALPLVRFRAQAMQDAVPVGVGRWPRSSAGRAGWPAGCAEVAAASGEVVEAVNFNDPKQTVIAGTKSGVEQACVAPKAGVPSAPRAYRCRRPFTEPDEAGGGTPARTPGRDGAGRAGHSVVNNVDVACETDPDRIRDALYRQAFGPVRWSRWCRQCAGRALTRIVECGPGQGARRNGPAHRRRAGDRHRVRPRVARRSVRWCRERACGRSARWRS